MDFPELLDQFRSALGGHVLELGSHTGSRVTVHLAEIADSVTCIELDSVAVHELRGRLPHVRVIHADWSEAVRSVSILPDAVILWGVLSHSPGPLALIEDLINYQRPQWVLLESEPGGLVRCVREAVNQPGQRQSRKPTSGISIQLGSRVYSDAMTNLGYELAKTVLPTGGPKQGLEFTLWRLRDRV